MKYTVEKAEKSQIKVTLTLENQDWDSSVQKAYHKIKSRFNIQGFRKGKAPFAVICSQYGKDIFYEDALNIAIGDFYPEVLNKESDIRPVGDPDIKLNNFSENEVVLDIFVPVVPEVKLGDYKGIKIDKIEYNVTDADIDAELNKLLERNAREISVTDRACQNGDTVVIDFSGSVDGVKFEGGTAEKYRLGLGTNSFVPGFEDQVCGMKISETKDINVTFPEDYSEELKGKNAVFAVKLHDIFVKEFPNLDDEFIKDAVGEESVEAYKTKIREGKEKENTQRAGSETEDKMLDEIAKTTVVEIPDIMIENEAKNMMEQLEYRLSYQGLKLSDYMNMTGQTEESMKSSYKEIAIGRVKKQLIVNKIIELESIKATNEEIDIKIAEQAQSVSKDVEDYKKTMDPRQFEYIENTLIVDKLFAFLKENNDIA